MKLLVSVEILMSIWLVFQLLSVDATVLRESLIHKQIIAKGEEVNIVWLILKCLHVFAYHLGFTFQMTPELADDVQ